MAASPLLNLAEAAAYLRINQQELRDKANRAELAVVRTSNSAGKPTGKMKFRQSDLDAWIERNRIPAK